jgi:hypothetical protein
VVLGAVAYFVFDADLFVAIAFPVVAALVGLPSRPLAFIRRWLTSGLEIGASMGEVRRGEEFEVLVTVPSNSKLIGIDVGLVCTELYDEESSHTDSDGHTHTSRQTSRAIAYEAWLPVEIASGVQNVRLAIPGPAPFSYEGECLSFEWEIVARGRRRRGIDLESGRKLAVLP